MEGPVYSIIVSEMSQPSTVDSSLSHEGDNIETDASSSNDERADASCNGTILLFFHLVINDSRCTLYKVSQPNTSTV